MNVFQVVALADRIASWFSHEAVQWRPVHVHTRELEPITLAFRFVGGAPSYGHDLIAALRLRTAAPYSGMRYGAGVPIVAADESRPARAVVELRVDEREGDAGIAYELRFTDSNEVPAGWFRLAER